MTSQDDKQWAFGEEMHYTFVPNKVFDLSVWNIIYKILFLQQNISDFSKCREII